MPTLVRKYQQKISGPLLDRVDLHVDVPCPAEEELVGYPLAELSVAIRARACAAREARVFAACTKPPKNV